MKYFILCLLGILASCSYSSSDGEWLRDEKLDNLKLSVCDAGCKEQHFELQLNDEEKEQLKTWLKSLTGSHIDLNSYAPTVILKGKTFQVNMMENRIVISCRKGSDPKEGWKQYSRPETTEDQHIRNWLMQLNRR